MSIAHVDCDAFFASVEQRDDPNLRGKPVIVGGTKGRGVVSACSYETRVFGVRSAMPMAEALRRCPDAITIAPSMKKYSVVSKEIRTLFEELTPAIEPLSIDEAFLDLSGTERLHKAPPAVMLARLANKIQSEIGITVSVGLSHNKFLAKIASDLDKPHGYAILGRQDAPDFLKKQPVSIIFGVGKAAVAKLEKDGIATIGDLLPLDQKTLAERYGSNGLRLYALARGEDKRAVKTSRVAKGLSHETTFSTDKKSFDALDPALWRMCEKVAQRLRTKGQDARTITLKLKTVQFKSITRSTTLSTPTDSAYVLYDACAPLLKKELNGRTTYRLLGVAVSNIVDHDSTPAHDLFANTAADKRRDLEVSMDQLRHKFGDQAIQMGRGLSTRKPPSPDSGADER